MRTGNLPDRQEIDSDKFEEIYNKFREIILDKFDETLGLAPWSTYLEGAEYLESVGL